MAEKQTALIVGAGSGLSASLARLFASEGMTVALAARNPDKLSGLASEISAKTYAADVADPASVAKLFDALDGDMGTPDIVVFNPSYRTRGAIAELDPGEVRKTLMITCFGGFLVGQQAIRRMEEKGGGTILFTGASASVKGYVNSAPFAMGKFGLRGLIQSMARELQPKNIHVAHFVIDGGIGKSDDDTRLDPDAVAQTYLDVHRQHRSAWTWEVELRPWKENF